MQYPIGLPKQFMDATLSHFRDQEVPVGGKFDDAVRGSFGDLHPTRAKNQDESRRVRCGVAD
jgi:hypothetical protein